MTIAVQKLRRDLYFLHAAVLEFAGKAFLLAGASGQGKSTTARGLFRYLSGLNDHLKSALGTDA